MLESLFSVYAAYGFGKVEEYAHKIDAFKDLMELF